MRVVDFFPSQGCYSPGETVTFYVEVESFATQTVTFRIFIQHLTDQLVILEKNFQLAPGEQTIQIQWSPPARPAGYSARLQVGASNGPGAIHMMTAFDVLHTWTDFPRYGFLTDFGVSRADPETVLKKLARFHINGLQFYDWQYRHDQLLAPTEVYIDPLGRGMSLDSVRKLVDTAHKYGMASMPYLAIYAASMDFWRAHPDWALHDEAGEPIAFGDNFLGLMDPSADSPWSKHLLSECAHTLQSIPFDGLHIDQYGDPKLGWDSFHNPVDLPRAFADFIQSASDQHPDQAILFNAVGNWPIQALAESAVDFSYIEVWPPDVEYRHLAEIVLNAVRLSRGKSVVIALYLPANRPANNLLADAVILACGGTRIELGEETRLLCDPYFPKHEAIAPNLYAELRRLSDFAVRNGEWLSPYTLSVLEKEVWAVGELNPKSISTDASVWIVSRYYPGSLALQIMNFSGLDPHQRWDDAHAAPTPCREISIKIQRDRRPSQVLWNSPEQTGGLQALNFDYHNGTLIVQIPQINFIGLVIIHD